MRFNVKFTGNGEVDVTNTHGQLNRTISTTSDSNSVTYDISYTYTTTTETGDQETTQTVDVTEFSALVVNELNIGKDLQIIKVHRAENNPLKIVIETAETLMYQETTALEQSTGMR